MWPVTLARGVRTHCCEQGLPLVRTGDGDLAVGLVLAQVVLGAARVLAAVRQAGARRLQRADAQRVHDLEALARPDL